MKDSLSVVSDRAVKPPAEKARLYLLLSFLHAVIQERLRYAPTLGWKGFWEFNDSDYEFAAVIIDTLMNTAAHERTNIAPSKIPWDLIRRLVVETYGGKIDDEADFAELDSLVSHILAAGAFDNDYKLVPGGQSRQGDGLTEDDGGLPVPTGTRMVDFMEWVERLPEREPPTYLGLPANAEKLLLVGHGQKTIENVARITEILEEGEQFVDEEV
jgi:dynein heavy chain 1